MRWIPRQIGALVPALAATLLVLGPGLRSAPTSVAQDGPSGSVDAQVQQLAAENPIGSIPVLIQRAAGAGGLDALIRHGATVREQIEFHNLVAADVPASELETLAGEPGIERISYDAPVQSLSTTYPLSASNLKSVYPQAVRAAELWSAHTPIQGTGVTVAVLDSGVKGNGDFMGANGTGTSPGSNRLIAKIISIAGQASADDDNGHGTWVAGIIGGRGWGSNNGDLGNYIGTAPNANLIGVKVSDSTGQSQVSNVISGLQWVVNNKDTYNIRVVNLSLVSSTAESYKTSELDAAVEMAWLHGLVVVVSAGNSGPNTELYAPANDPYVITVGAVDDNGSQAPSAATLLAFSSYGTTQDGFAKPELVAPGRHIVSTLYSNSAPLAQQFPTRLVDNNAYIRLSGTSASAPIVSGVVADLLQANPNLTPDQVKWLLQHTAAPISGVGTGAGYPQAAAAVAYRGTVGSANVGVVPNNKIAAAGCATLPGCNSSTNWSTVSWNTVSWNTVSWNTVSWNTVSWNATWEVSSTD
jgi:serine protease AprX